MMGTPVIMIGLLVVATTTGPLQDVGADPAPPVEQEVAAAVRALLAGADGPEPWDALAVVLDGHEAGSAVSAAGASARAVADSLRSAGPGLHPGSADRLWHARAAIGSVFRESSPPAVGIALALAWVPVLLLLRAAWPLVRVLSRGRPGGPGRTKGGARPIGSALDRRPGSPQCRDAVRLRARIRTIDVARP